jgi:hypothetical protein
MGLAPWRAAYHRSLKRSDESAAEIAIEAHVLSLS